MASHSGSDSDSIRSRSISPHNGPIPTPGHGLRSPSHSPSPPANPSRQSPSHSRSPASSARSASAESNKSSRSGSGSRKSSRSRSGSRKSRSRSGSRKSRSRSGSRKSRSRSRSRKSRSRSGSRASSRTGTSRSGSAASNRSKSGSPASRRSKSGSPASRRSKSGSPASRRSKSGSPASRRSKSGSRTSRRSKSGSRASRRSKSGSPASGRSKSGSPTSNRSRSRSVESRRSGSRSRSRSGSKAGSGRSSRSNSPNLQIDEAAPSPAGEKRKRDSSDDRTTIRKKSNIIDSESEEEEREEPQKTEGAEGGKTDGREVSTAADIFGDDADDISSDEDRPPSSRADDDSDRERRHTDDDERHKSDGEHDRPQPGGEAGEKENEPEPIPETRIDVEIPKISCDLGKDIHFVKLPNFLSVETRPFDPETYEDEIDEEETLDEEGRARLKLKVENTIRWRENVDKEGNIKKESNARFVRWSDGSYSLHLGSEIFDVYKQPLQGDHNHLFIRQGTGLQGQAVFRTKLSFRPHSTESFTHRKMTLSLADRSQKTSGIKILSQVGADPDQDRKLLLKKEEEKLRQTVRVSKPRRRGDASLRTHNTSSYREEEGSDEDGAISLNAIKNKYKSGAATASAKGGAIYSSDEEGSDIESRRNRKVDKSRALKDWDSGESE